MRWSSRRAGSREPAERYARSDRLIMDPRPDRGVRPLSEPREEVRLLGHSPVLAGDVPLRFQENESVIDLTDLTFATPFDLVGIAAWLSAAPAGQRILLRRPRLANVSSYLQRMDLFSILGDRIEVEPALPSEEPRDLSRPLVELHRIEEPEDVDDLLSSVYPRMREMLTQEVCDSFVKMLGSWATMPPRTGEVHRVCSWPLSTTQERRPTCRRVSG
jgi:hypothetical protein